eukprot:g515.t1
MQYRDPYSDHLYDRVPYPGVQHPSEGDNRIFLAHGEGGISQLVEVISDPATSEDGLINAMSILLAELSCQEKKASAVSCGLVGAVREGLESGWRVSPYEGAGQKAVDARCLALDVLGSLALSKDGRADMLKENCVEVLYKLLTDSQWKEHRCAAARVIRVLSDSKDGCKILLLGDGLPKDALLASLEDSVEGGVVQLCMTEAIANLTTSSKGIQLVLSCSALRQIVGFLQLSNQEEDESKQQTSSKLNSKNRRSFLCAILRIVWNLAHDTAGNAACISVDAVSLICKCLHNVMNNKQWDDVERVGAGALMALAISLDGKKKIEDCSVSVELLTTLVSRSDSSIVTNAKQCICLAARYPPAGPRFVKALLPETELLCFVFDTEALKYLVAELQSEDEVCAEQAVAATALLTESEKGQKMACQVLHMGISLARLMVKGTRQAKRLAAQALTYICMSTWGKSTSQEVAKAMKNGKIEGFKRELIGFPSLGRVLTAELGFGK